MELCPRAARYQTGKERPQLLLDCSLWRTEFLWDPSAGSAVDQGCVASTIWSLRELVKKRALENGLATESYRCL